MNLGSIFFSKMFRDRLTKTKNLRIPMGTLVAGFLFSDFGVCFGFWINPPYNVDLGVGFIVGGVGFDRLEFGIDRSGWTRCFRQLVCQETSK
jgi:hypothetical protein